MRTFLRYGWLVLVAIGGVLAWIVFRRETPAAPIAREIDAIKAKGEADKLVAKVGHVEAVKAIEQKHQATVEALDQRQRVEAESLRKNPVALAGFLARLGSGKRPS